MINELIYSDATKLAELIRTKQVSPVESCRPISTASKPSILRRQRHRHVGRQERWKPPGAPKQQYLLARDLGPLHGVPFTAQGFDRH
jgi:aspartyl-tRNA(Asn)/glutamyl-tRNA(Gln) amidotransferase subunit A